MSVTNPASPIQPYEKLVLQSADGWTLVAERTDGLLAGVLTSVYTTSICAASGNPYWVERSYPQPAAEVIPQLRKEGAL